MAKDNKISNSFYTLNKCNPRLSGNIKFVCDEDNIYLDSINSNSELARSLYKAYKLNTTSNLMVNLKNYADLFDIKDNIFDVKSDSNLVTKELSEQHERIYNYGAYSDVSELITKRFRFFAPIYIDKEATKPDLFVVYRVNRNDFNKGKPFIKELVHVHDFRSSEMGKQLDRHIKYMKDNIDDIGVFANFEEGFSFTGTSLNSGLLETKYDNNMVNVLANERTLTEFNHDIVDGFRKNEMIDSRFLNLEFCFDLDLSNDDLNDTFVDLIGFYTTMDELESLNEFNDTEAHFKIIENKGTITMSQDVLTESDLNDNPVVVDTLNAIQFTSFTHSGDFTPLIMIKPNFLPSVGEKLILELDGVTEIEYTISEDDIVVNDIMKTAENIAKSFTLYARTNISNLFVDALIFENEYLVIKSLINDESYKNIKLVEKPRNYSIIPLKFTDNVSVYENTFYSPSSDSVLTAFPIPLDVNGGDSLNYKENTSKVIEMGKWLGYYFFNLESSIREDNPNGDIINVIKTEKSKLYRLKTCEHRAFDFDRENTYHGDVFDFELNTYKQWLLNQVSDENFLGKYDVMPSESEMSEYKAELVSIISRYFDSISLERGMLIGDVNTSSFEATSIDNEFNRLSENLNHDLISNSMINQSINKFMYKDGLDVYNRPYTLNLAQPFRYSNFAPSLDIKDRDLRNATHSWLVIGTGLPPYMRDLNVGKIPAIKDVEIDTEQPTNIIQRFYTDINEPDEISEWFVLNGDLIDSGDGGIKFSPNNSQNYISRKLDIREQGINSDIKFSFNFSLENSANTSVRTLIEIVDLDNMVVIDSWNVDVNLIGGVSENIIDTKVLSLGGSAVGENNEIRISLSYGHTSDLTIYDLNFHKTTLTLPVYNPEIKINDSIKGFDRHINDILTSYTVKHITKEDVLSTDFDVYNYIRSHSIIKKEDDLYSCFFRGVKIVLDSKYEGWKFSAILNTSTAPESKDRDIELLENEAFKSITLYVTMYVPEPVLTGLEQEGVYWLDRSLLYFSDGDYATETSLSSFGRKNISLRINDSSSPKTYLGNFKTNDWYFQQNGINYVHVGKGLLERFDVDFTSFLELRQNFEVYFGDTDDSETTNFGMLITFMDIQEIGKDHFWCTEIHVKIKETESGVTTTIEYDMLAEYLANNNVFYEQNKMDIVEAILLENAEYDRVLKNVGAIERFSLISTSDIMDWIKSNNTTVTDIYGNTSLLDIYPIEPVAKMAVIGLKNVNNDILNRSDKYTINMIRQNGLYTPITKQLRKSSYFFSINYTDYGYSYKTSKYNILPSSKNNSDRLNDKVWFYRKDFSETILSKHYRVYSDKKDFKNLHWFSNPMEYKHDISLVLSSKKVIEFDVIKTDSDIIDVYSNVKDYLKRILENYGFDLKNFTEQDKIDILGVDNNTNSQNISQFDFEDIILRRFFDSEFSKIYVISKVLKGDVEIDFYSENPSSLELFDNVDLNENLKILIDRV
ncbi:hypothetical protein BPT24_145 [Tenacibaculum phage pT24]|uniref:Uncharacterized protein n=1 Tax=Tenacibaculum phage pT24 TaxID=1880590 RepID=A0A1B4XWS8_9CAUD|nr:hypothetical protein HYP10_gp145 [Tenacibaculum phage pT24]BAV39271.1 hypothetical protein BPT24_145 [Tenacibaculum phage pT24]